MTGQRLVFIVGAPRSGTTWLQRLMGAHPEVVTTQETELVDRYCASLQAIWTDQLVDDAEQWRGNRHRGLPALLTAEEFRGHLVGFAEGVYAKALALKPTAQVVVDKNPSYSLHIGLIRHLFPEALVIHIVRDGRDVAASMLAASRGWGRHWAPRRMRLAAQTWRKCVEGALAAAGSGPYLQVRYEELLADTPGILGECFRQARVPATAAECARFATQLSLSGGAQDGAADPLVWAGEVVARLGKAPTEPPGFFGSGGSGGWRTGWTTRDRLEFYAVAGGLLRQLGYEPYDRWVASTSRIQRARASATGYLAAAAVRLGWQAHMALGRRSVYVHLARVEPPYPPAPRSRPDHTARANSRKR